MTQVRAPLQGAVVRVVAPPGTAVEPSSPVVVVESMKMEHAVEAGVTGTIAKVTVAEGDQVVEGDVVAVVDVAEVADVAEVEPTPAFRREERPPAQPVSAVDTSSATATSAGAPARADLAEAVAMLVERPAI
ncbi:MAG TPA: biotin/lipoyl-containing protein, partial [Acidimicrobiales bacterium]|nr:biotin/lipoyl-containing protein [Acidimicrobiales bacterium]